MAREGPKQTRFDHIISVRLFPFPVFAGRDLVTLERSTNYVRTKEILAEFKLDTPISATDLGLICLSLCLGGCVHLRSVPGRSGVGSTFWPSDGVTQQSPLLCSSSHPHVRDPDRSS